MPDEVLYVWVWFMDLMRFRTFNEVGPQAIQPSEIESWARQKDVRLAPHEFEALLALDFADRVPGDD